jgi:uncharacterized membrane protein
VVVDNIVTTVWMVATLTIPRAIAYARGRADRTAVRPTGSVRPTGPIVDLVAETETMDPRQFAVVLAMGGAVLWVSNVIAGLTAAAGVAVPSILIITVIALALAQVPVVAKVPGSRVVGMFAVYLFLTVIGVFCDVGALSRLGDLGMPLLMFASITVAVHGAVIFGAAWLFGMDVDSAAVASQANVGGGTSALALAKSLGREDLLVPGILLGSLGNGIGTFLGFLAVRLL